MRPFRDDRYREQNKYTRNANLNNQLQDLDMELEILKRQREIINQRQMGSAFMSERQSMYNSPFPPFDRFEPKDNYGVNDYPNFGSSNKMVEKSFKRPYDRNWPSTSAPKQPRQINPWQDQYDHRPTFKPKPQPLMASAPQYKKKVKPIPKPADKPRPEFNPTKVTKAKNLQNKPHTNIPHAAKGLTDTNTKAKKVFGPNEILRPFIDPTPSMRGRLELALGEITKDIKRSRSVDKPIMEQITFAGTQRQVKNVIRQRISSIMMNKIVGPPAEIVALYRKSFPDMVDEEIMTIINSAPVMKRPHVTVTPMASGESAEISAFFKSNITRLLSDKMQEMIDNLGKLYGDNEKEILKCIIDLPNFEDTISESNKEESKSNEEAEANKSNTEENKGDTVEDITQQSDNAENNKSSEKSNDGTGNNTEAKSSDTVKQDTTAMKTDEKDQSTKLEQYYKLMDLLIIKRLPKMLVKFKDNFANVMYCEKDFIIAREMIIKEVKDKLRKALYAANSLNSDGTKIEVSKTLPVPKVNGQSDPNPESDGKDTEVITVEESNTANISTQDNIPQKVNTEQLFVMLLGRPCLPPKADIHEFLNKFNPQSIKKHKTVNNLLVISFNNRQDYDNILAANESKVGDSVFIIKANEVVSSEKTSNADISDDGNSEKITQKVQDGEVNEEMQEKNEMKKPDNITKTTEENKMKTIVEDDEDDDLQIVEEEPDVIEVHNETKNEAKNETKSEDKSVKDVNVATPVRSSSRLANATPSTIKTRRASQLAQKNGIE